MSRHKRVEGSSSDYAIGYRKPPKHSQFKPGKSGNPRGRPRGRKNLITTFHEIMHEKVPIREGGRLRKISKFEAVIRILWQRASGGDPKAIAAILAHMKDLKDDGLFDDHRVTFEFVEPDRETKGKK